MILSGLNIYNFNPFDGRCRGSCRTSVRSFSNCLLHHSIKDIWQILSCSFRLSVGSGVICAVTRSTVNLQLCSSKYNFQLYSSGLPLISVVVCCSSNPTVWQRFSIRIIS